jgi:hypothetical protein
VPGNEGKIRIMTFLDGPFQVSSEQTTTMIKRRNRLPMRNAARVEPVAEALETDELSQPGRREVGGFLPLRGPAHLDLGNVGS